MVKKIWGAFVAFVSSLFAEIRAESVTFIDEDANAVGEVRKVFHVLWDDKRTFGFIYLALALTLPFILPGVDIQVLGAVAAVGFALYLGVPLGDSVPFVAGLKSLGLFDLVTNKANQGDGFRVFGVLFQLAALGFILRPIWNHTAVTSVETFLFLGGVGVVMSWSAIWGDHVAVKNTGAA